MECSSLEGMWYPINYTFDLIHVITTAYYGLNLEISPKSSC